MRALVRHVSRSFIANASTPVTQSSTNSLRCFTTTTPNPTCISCQLRTFPIRLTRRDEGLEGFALSIRTARRHFTSSTAALSKEKPPESSEPVFEGQIPSQNLETPNTIPLKSPEGIGVHQAEGIKAEGIKVGESKVEDTIKRVPAEDLPSHREGQRWDFSKRVNEIMDDLLPKIATLTQKVNTYTGTDYSGIEALRREIKEQEKLVKARRLAIEEAKQSLDAAHAQQASAQKEVVALLERKHSWSPNDLERYMSLIRSEHVNDQAVREAKEAVLEREAALEESRAHLEKRERAQYHEEQIWSDTIRRNSTWVTFGLMGVNILLLLASLTVIEPWRRRRMVREIKTALDAQKTAAAPALASPRVVAIEQAIDKVVEPAETTTNDKTSASPPDASNTTVTPTLIGVGPEVDPAPGVKVNESIPAQADQPFVAANPVTEPPVQNTPEAALIEATIAPDETKVPKDVFSTWQSKVATVAQDIVSERVISMRRIDYTTSILQGAAAGAVISAALIMMMVKPQ